MAEAPDCDASSANACVDATSADGALNHEAKAVARRGHRANRRVHCGGSDAQSRCRAEAGDAGVQFGSVRDTVIVFVGVIGIEVRWARVEQDAASDVACNDHRGAALQQVVRIELGHVRGRTRAAVAGRR